MKIICTCALVLSLVLPSPLWAADTIRERASELARIMPPAQAASGTADGSGALIWGGVGLMGAGATLEILANTSMKITESGCLFNAFGYSCFEETHTNRPLLFTGIGVVVLGGILMDIGFRKRRNAKANPSITITPHQIRASVSVGF